MNLLHLVEKENLKFKFKIQSRADLLLQENYVSALTKAGCENIWMGAESGSQKILDAMDKGTTIQQIAELLQSSLNNTECKPSFFIQFGYLGETKEDIKKTINMINTLLPHSIGISVSYPLPGTMFYENVKSELTTKTNWTDSDEMALMFKNTYQPAFYKQLYSYVHKTYRRHLALSYLKQNVIHPASVKLLSVKKLLSLAYYLPLEFIAKFKLNAFEKS